MNVELENKEELRKILKERFEKHPKRHEGITWEEVEHKLEQHPQKERAVFKMEQTGGEPDVIGTSSKEPLTFYDCSPETPSGRRSCCYDPAALDARKKNKPETSALQMAEEMGIELLNEQEYRFLQQFGEFDLKTSSWIKTPLEIRQKGGALFCDRRYDHVFTYHNSAESYYASRGFRGAVTIE